MIKLTDATFEAGQLPHDWIVDIAPEGFENGALKSGRATLFNIPLPPHSKHKLRIEVDIEPIQGAEIVCSDHSISIIVDLSRQLSRVTAYGGAVLAETKQKFTFQQRKVTVAFEFDTVCIKAFVMGREVVSVADPLATPLGSLLRIGFWQRCLVHRIRIFTDAAASRAVPAIVPKKDFFLEVTVDFLDDLLHVPFSLAMFDQLFAELKSWGTRRVHWIYYGGTKHGWWKGTPFRAEENVQKTLADVGDFLPVAVAAAHRHGMEIYGLIKPFDMGFWASVGESDPRAKTWGRLPLIGGPVGRIADFLVERRDLCMARKPQAYGASKNKVLNRIDLVKEDTAPADFKVTDVRLYVSDDNTTYRPYLGTCVREEVVVDYPVWEHTSSGGRPTGLTRPARVMRLSELKISEKYCVLQVESRSASFANSLINLIHVFGEQGEERLLTYGIQPRSKQVIDGAVAIDVAGSTLEDGVNFNVCPGTPNAVHPNANVFEQNYAFDSRAGILAFARGKDKNPVACLSPSFPEARAWWLEWVRDCLDAGADGVEMRVANHHSPFAWTEFGFEEPVVQAFKKRYGVDLWTTDDFDRPAWESLRGEAYTQFYREVKNLVASYGKKLGIHIRQTKCFGPSFGSAMAVHWDWQTWLAEELADSITMKEVWPQSRFSNEIMEYARPRNIPAVFSPYANLLWSTPGGVDVCAQRIQHARASGFDGFQFYECAAVVRGMQDGRVEMLQPALRDLLRREFS